MAKFEKIKKYENIDFNLPSRKTSRSAGYDFEVAEDIVIPPYRSFITKLSASSTSVSIMPELKDVARWTKEQLTRPTLVPTGVKCKLADDEYLELSVRSSTPLKYLLVLANGIGIIDADYYNNVDNEGHIYFQILNLGLKPVKLNKGDIIGQGIIRKYNITEDDAADGERVGGFGSTSN